MRKMKKFIFWNERNFGNFYKGLSGSTRWESEEIWEKMFPNEKQEKFLIWEIRCVVRSSVFWELSVLIFVFFFFSGLIDMEVDLLLTWRHWGVI